MCYLGRLLGRHASQDVAERGAGGDAELGKDLLKSAFQHTSRRAPRLPVPQQQVVDLPLTGTSALAVARMHGTLSP